MTHQPAHQPLPAWSRAYQLPDETRHDGRVAELEAKIAALVAERDALERDHDTLAVHKHLFASDGAAFASQIEWALRTLGFSVQSADEGGESSIARWNGRTLAFESRGYRSEPNDSEVWVSLQRKVSEFVQAHRERPKGLAIVNAFLDTRLDDRKIGGLPEKLINNLRYDHYCLVSGLQLLNMALTARAESGRKDGLVELLYSTDGLLRGFDDWRMHLRPGDAAPVPAAAGGLSRTAAA